MDAIWFLWYRMISAQAAWKEIKTYEEMLQTLIMMANNSSKKMQKTAVGENIHDVCQNAIKNKMEQIKKHRKISLKSHSLVKSLQGHVLLSLSLFSHSLAESGVSRPPPPLPVLSWGQRSQQVTTPYKHSTYHHGTIAGQLDDRLLESDDPLDMWRGIKLWYAHKCVCQTKRKWAW